MRVSATPASIDDILYPQDTSKTLHHPIVNGWATWTTNETRTDPELGPASRFVLLMASSESLASEEMLLRTPNAYARIYPFAEGSKSVLCKDIRSIKQTWECLSKLTKDVIITSEFFLRLAIDLSVKRGINDVRTFLNVVINEDVLDVTYSTCEEVIISDVSQIINEVDEPYVKFYDEFVRQWSRTHV
jgi:hypothetical protein